MRVVIDTNVLVSALRSRRGASFRLVQLLGKGQFQPVISPPLCLEYEDVFRRREMLPGYSDQDIDDLRDFKGVESLGIAAMTPDAFLARIIKP